MNRKSLESPIDRKHVLCTNAPWLQIAYQQHFKPSWDRDDWLCNGQFVSFLFNRYILLVDLEETSLVRPLCSSRCFPSLVPGLRLQSSRQQAVRFQVSQQAFESRSQENVLFSYGLILWHRKIFKSAKTRLHHGVSLSSDSGYKDRSGSGTFPSSHDSCIWWRASSGRCAIWERKLVQIEPQRTGTQLNGQCGQCNQRRGTSIWEVPVFGENKDSSATGLAGASKLL